MPRRAFLIGVLLTSIFLATPGGQTINTQVQFAITQLINGITPFANLRLTQSTYQNWGSTSGVNGYGFRDSAGQIQVKDSGGAWTPVISSSGAPTNASYWTRVSESGLTNETIMASLTTGLVINTTTTGVPTAYTGTSCTNQFPRSLSAVGVATCATVAFLTDTSGTVSVARGGTNLTTGTSGGILGFTAAGTIASSTLLTANMLIIGGGAGVLPLSLGTLGTTTTVLHGNAAGIPSFSAIVLTTDVSGILPVANGGTNNAFFTVSGPAASAKTYTFPNSNATVLTDASAITAAQGGTGQTTYAVGDILQASAATTLSKLNSVSTGNALISGGVTTVSSWGKIGLTTHVSGTLPVASGGTNITSYTVGDLIYASGATTLAKLADVAVGQVLISGGVGVAPAWSATATVTNLVNVATTTTAGSAGTTVQSLVTTTTGDDPTEVFAQYRTTTNNATPVAIATFAIPVTTTRQFWCAVTARRTGGASGTAEDGAAYIFQVVMKNVAGSATEIAAETLTVIGEDQAAWTVTAAPTAGNEILSVTGEANNDITWHASCRSYAVGS